MNPLIIHHDDPDGWAAAWVLRRALRSAEIVATNYGKPPPWEAIHRANDVWLVDYSYPIDKLRDIESTIPGVVTVIDHHTTAVETLQTLPSNSGRLRAVFDETRSGCGLTWDTVYVAPRPWLIDYIEDRDLWRFALPDSREINAAIASYDMSFALLDRLAGDAVRDQLASEGRAILRYQAQIIKDMCADPPTYHIGTDMVPCVPCQSPRLISELGHALSEGHPFAAVFHTSADGTTRMSLRSREGGADVSRIARAFGGGGHTHAAGYTVR